MSTRTGPSPTAAAPAVPIEATTLAERVAAAVLAQPGVAGLHRGIYGDVTTWLPGRRLTGVRLTDGEPVAVGVVLNLDRPIPEVVRRLRATVSELCGGAAVDITVGDVALPGEPAVPTTRELR